jgi:GT2 family glycosyltransferase
MLVRGAILRTVGLLDEAFFMYGEDLDWAMRIKRAGWKIMYNGQVTVTHYKRASSRQRSTQSLIAFYQAMLIFFQKHYAPQSTLALRWLVVAGIYLRAGLALAQNRSHLRELARLQPSR